MFDYYFLGIGGVSMSALAMMLKSQGKKVSGSDDRQSQGTKILQENGIEVDFCMNKQSIENAKVIVYSSAIKPNNAQFVFAKSVGKKMLVRGQILGKIAKRYQKVIAVAGSHGKTTTTALVYEILKEAGQNPTLHLGGYRVEDNRNLVIGEDKFFVTEACEYCDNFLFLSPFLSVITNVEKEHMDYFKTFERQKLSFEKFKSQSKFCIDDVGTLRAKYIHHNQSGEMSFSIFDNKRKIMRLKTHFCEEINAQNCIFAYLAAKKLQISDEDIKNGIEKFCGVHTRFERRQSPYFDTVICDYAHHPTEIEKSIKSAEKIFKNKALVTIFQPHTFSRTKTLLPEFLKVFKKQTCPIFFKTYSARENPNDGLSAEEFTKILKKTNKNAKYFEDFEDLRKFLLKFDKFQTVLLFIGAGDLPEILNKNHFFT